MKPQLDHNVGKQVEQFTENDDGWTLKFEDGMRIDSTDTETQQPDPTGMILMSVDENENQWQMNFGTIQEPASVQVVVTNLHFTINGEDPWNDDDEEDTTPPDPSADRIYESAPEDEKN